MRVFISADMEGITGITSSEDVVREEPEYNQGTDLLHRDVNAAIKGAVEGSAETVLVNDSHSSMRNLDRDRLHKQASLIRGNTKPRSMMQGLTSDHDLGLFVGYHAMMGTPEAVLNHTFYGHELSNLWVNDTEVGELGWNARLAGSLGVPIGLVTGDDATIAEANEELSNPETVTVKRGIDRFSAECFPPAETEPAIQDAAQTAVQRAAEGKLSIPHVETPTTITAGWATTNLAAKAATVPGIERESGRLTSVSAPTYPEAFEATVGMLRAGRSGADQYYG